MSWEFSGIGDIRARTTSADPMRFELHVGLAPDFQNGHSRQSEATAASRLCRLLQGRYRRWQLYPSPLHSGKTAAVSPPEPTLPDLGLQSLP